MRLGTSWALLALPSLTLAVSLADFTPRASNLPENCNNVYRQEISDCSSSDFSGDGCGQGCIDGMNEIVKDVQQACGELNLNGSSVIGAFLAGDGPGELCPNANSNATTSSSASSSSATDKANSTSRANSTASSTTSATSTTSSLIPTTSTTPTTTSASATSTSAQGRSGGGSPFDTPMGTASTGPTAYVVSTIALALAVLIAAVIEV